MKSEVLQQEVPRLIARSERVRKLWVRFPPDADVQPRRERVAAFGVTPAPLNDS